jgi:hypothetical protein
MEGKFAMQDFVFIKEANYENVLANCPMCQHENVFNRATDLKSFEPVARMSVTCQTYSCSHEFDIIGDAINPSYEMLIFECTRHFAKKQYMAVVANICQSYEMFFSHLLQVYLVYNPMNIEEPHALKELNVRANTLFNFTKSFAFADMRRCAIHTAAIRTRAPVLDHKLALEHINKMKSAKKAKVFLGVDDIAPELKVEWGRIENSSIGDQRNNVVHKTAYRPTFAIARECFDEARETLLPLGQKMNLNKTASWYLNR